MERRKRAAAAPYHTAGVLPPPLRAFDYVEICSAWRLRTALFSTYYGLHRLDYST
jgi:hypothetical protein